MSGVPSIKSSSKPLRSMYTHKFFILTWRTVKMSMRSHFTCPCCGSAGSSGPAFLLHYTLLEPLSCYMLIATSGSFASSRITEYSPGEQRGIGLALCAPRRLQLDVSWDTKVSFLIKKKCWKQLWAPCSGCMSADGKYVMCLISDWLQSWNKQQQQNNASLSCRTLHAAVRWGPWYFLQKQNLICRALFPSKKDVSPRAVMHL